MPTRDRVRAGNSAPRDVGAVRRYGMAHVIGAVMVVTLGTGLVTWNVIRGRNVDIATARAWDIKGPPCPQLSADQWAAGHFKAPKTFDYDGTTLGRWSGDASCSDVHDKGGAGFSIDKVCQFTNPTVLTVTSAAGTVYFNPGVGQPATVAVHKDQPKCVLGSKFTRATE
jgi:hypothetical protein